MVKGKPRPSFFKAMIGDFSSSMMIPQSFNKHLRGKAGEKCVLATRGGGRWKVDIGRGSSGEFSLLDGWKRFVKYHSISLGDFLVFFYDGSFRFDVHVYGKSGCDLANELGSGKKKKKKTKEECFKKRVRIRGTSSALMGMGNEGRRAERNSAFRKACAFKPPNPHFTIVYRPSFAHRTTIPRPLAKEYGLKEKKFITLQGPSASSWQCKLSTAGDGRVYLYAWTPFLKGNHIKDGDACVFEFLHNGDLLNVHIFPAGEKEEATESAYTYNIGDPVQSNEQNLRWADQEKALAAANFREAIGDSVHLNEQNLRSSDQENALADSVHSNEQNLRWTDQEKVIAAANIRAAIGDSVHSNEQNLRSTDQENAFADSVYSKEQNLRPADQDNALSAANSFKTKYPNFVFSWRKSRLYYVNIPQSLTGKLRLEIDQTVLLKDPFGRSWCVKIQSWTEGRSMILGLGWSKFARGNCLLDGDACLFEFAEGAEIIVHIFRANGTNETMRGTR